MPAAHEHQVAWAWTAVIHLFPNRRYLPVVPDAPDLRPATAEELKEALAYALASRGRKRHHHADGFMAGIAAERLVEHLRLSGFIVMKRLAAPPGRAP